MPDDRAPGPPEPQSQADGGGKAGPLGDAGPADDSIDGRPHRTRRRRNHGRAASRSGRGPRPVPPSDNDPPPATPRPDAAAQTEEPDHPVPQPPTVRPTKVKPSGADANRRQRSGRDDHFERGLRGLVGAGPTQVNVSAALRARDASRPTAEDLAAAEAELTIVRRHYIPPS